MFMLDGLLKALFNRDRTSRREATLAFECPQCREVRLGDVIAVYSQSAEGMVLRRECQERYFQCRTCTRKFNADSFKKDDQGVYEVRQWDCPNCKQLNPCTTFGCTQCGFILR